VARQTIRFAVAECSLGSLLVATERGVCCVQLGNDADAWCAAAPFSPAELVGGCC
jgi:AraC family transcriptional regulator of adaptative response/methylated-DNA-[protein]-cysteine methyltransferase